MMCEVQAAAEGLWTLTFPLRSSLGLCAGLSSVSEDSEFRIQNRARKFFKFPKMESLRLLTVSTLWRIFLVVSLTQRVAGKPIS